MTETLQAVLVPSMILGSFCGLGLFEYPFGHPRPYLSYLYVLVILGFSSYLIYPTYYRLFLFKFSDIMLWMNFLILITTITSIFVSFLYFKLRFLYRHIHLQLCLISHKLNKIFKIPMLLQMLWSFAAIIAIYLDIRVILLSRTYEFRISGSSVRLVNFFKSFSFTILFLTSNYICQSIYNKVQDIIHLLLFLMHKKMVWSRNGSNSLTVTKLQLQVTFLVTLLVTAYFFSLVTVTCENCFLGKCDECPSITDFSNYLQQLLEKKNIHHVQFNAWTGTDRATLQTQIIPTAEFIEELCNKLLLLKPHLFIAKQQSQFFSEKKSNLNDGEVLVVLDFSENYKYIAQDASQAFHFNNTQCTVFPVVCYYKKNELKTCLRELAIVDHTLEVLGTPKEYQRLRNWINRIIIGWIVYVFHHFTYTNCMALIYSKIDINFTSFVKTMYIAILYNYPSYVIALSALISAAILGSPFCVNKCQCLNFTILSKFWESKRASIKTSARALSARARQIPPLDVAHVHLQLYLISHKLNKVFKVQMLIQMVWYFNRALSFCLLMYQFLGNHRYIRTSIYTINYLNVYFEFFLITILFFTLHYICQTVYNKVYIITEQEH
ncbi:hypothetical protein ALC57_08285 [Trachymyrmex cornetzi]|uniref:Gustatory receptor n=1 Tax=Trachymyrmex cornetzi TaxID=471704 RepID=A0A151J741_9HYME|nr:hypothetical protein ALC57_08285 [Trachymyrmex cornetzi]